MNHKLETMLRAVAGRLPAALRSPLGRLWRTLGLPVPSGSPQARPERPATPTESVLQPSAAVEAEQGEYGTRVQQEIARFAEEEVVNNLPRIFDYWSNKYLRPQLESFGFSYPEDFFARQIERQIERLGRPVRVVSVGSGNCDCEAHVAELLLQRNVTSFTIDCLDITDAMLKRGAELVREKGIESHFRFLNADFNRWSPASGYDVVIANQSLHHVSDLESLFSAIHFAIGEEGIFITSDMVGRNGHMRWPEALDIVQEFWKELPERYRYNVQLRRHEAKFGNWDCSVEGFEGIRAQDILPLALERFGFEFFYAYGNVIDPFIDRSFGPHFDADAEWDREFIDRIHARDEAEIIAGRIKPTHAMAVMRRDKSVKPVVWKNLTPEFCVRRKSAHA